MGQIYGIFLVIWAFGIEICITYLLRMVDFYVTFLMDFRKYKPIDVPVLIVLDIFNENQMREMANFAEIQLDKGEPNMIDSVMCCIWNIHKSYLFIVDRRQIRYDIARVGV